MEGSSIVMLSFPVVDSLRGIRVKINKLGGPVGVVLPMNHRC